MDGTIPCPQCERDVDDSLTWCPFCGAELRPGDTGESPSAAVSAAMDDGDAGLASTEADPFAASTPVPRPADDAAAAAAAGGTPGAPAKFLALGLAVLLLVGGAVAWFFFMGDDDTGDLSVNSAAVGDCWNDTDESLAGSEVVSIPEVPCSEPHDNEVFSVVTLGIDGVYPGTFALQSASVTRCLGDFEGYVGVPYRESPLDIYPLFPTTTSWLDGDREVICSLFMLDTSTMTGSQRGSSLRMVAPAIDVSGVGGCPALADATIGVAQGFIDYFDSLSEAELNAIGADIPADMLPVMKSESLLIVRAVELGCSFDDLNALVANRAGALTYETEFGGFIVEEITGSGFFATE
ncbi:MAG: septum formation family protein [Actinobacteria bacterium]|nr:septum formation family protein [Actinomycetota bacterium]